MKEYKFAITLTGCIHIDAESGCAAWEKMNDLAEMVSMGEYGADIEGYDLAPLKFMQTELEAVNGLTMSGNRFQKRSS